MPWISIGPTTQRNTETYADRFSDFIGRVSGRVEALTYAENVYAGTAQAASAALFVGSSGGGVWHTPRGRLS
jgi:hypothetical protein